jgi:hypothetical protein
MASQAIWVAANVIVFVVNWYKYADDDFAYLRIFIHVRHLSNLD